MIALRDRVRINRCLSYSINDASLGGSKHLLAIQEDSERRTGQAADDFSQVMKFRETDHESS
jgi:hypothetical protein